MLRFFSNALFWWLFVPLLTLLLFTSSFSLLQTALFSCVYLSGRVDLRRSFHNFHGTRHQVWRTFWRTCHILVIPSPSCLESWRTSIYCVRIVILLDYITPILSLVRFHFHSFFYLKSSHANLPWFIGGWDGWKKQKQSKRANEVKRSSA
jgi:hypothetical protein